MNETYIAMAIGTAIVAIGVYIIHENRRLRKLVKQQKEEIKRIKREQRICG